MKINGKRIALFEHTSGVWSDDDDDDRSRHPHSSVTDELETCKFRFSSIAMQKSFFVALENSTSTRKCTKWERKNAHGRSFRSRYEAVLTEKEFIELDN